MSHALKKYNELLKIKTLATQTKYPYSIMSSDEITKTMKEIEITYQHLGDFLVDVNSRKKGGRGVHPTPAVIVITL